MIKQGQKGIAGMHVSKTGEVSVVWLSHEPLVDDVTIVDAAIFKTEVPIVIAESINARGRWIPVAWSHQEMADSLLERGCRVLPERTSDSDEMAEMVSRDIWERMRTQRLHFDKRLRNWAEEAAVLERTNGKIPKDPAPLMAATRIAMSELRYARRNQPRKIQRKSVNRIAIV